MVSEKRRNEERKGRPADAYTSEPNILPQWKGKIREQMDGA
jgi:hypothetical protein